MIKRMKNKSKINNSQPGSKTIAKLQERFRQKQEAKEKEKKEQIERTKEEEERLDFVAFASSRKWGYHKLMMASDIKKAEIEGREVHGWMERMFPDYEWLIENDVLDRACYFAWQESQKIIHNFVKDYDFVHMTRSLVILPEKTFFTKFSEYEYDRMIIIADKPFREAVTWIPNYKWKTEDGYETQKTFAPCNFLNIGSPLYDLPILVLKDAIGKENLFFQAKTTSQALTKERNEVIRHQIFKLRVKEKENDEKIDELEIESNNAREKYSNLKKKMLSRDDSTYEEKLMRWKKNYERKRALALGFDKKRILLGIVAVLVVILIIIGLIFLFMPRPEGIKEAPEMGKLSLNILRGNI